MNVVYVWLVRSYACSNLASSPGFLHRAWDEASSNQVAFGADMLFVITVETLLAFNIVYGTAYTT